MNDEYTEARRQWVNEIQTAKINEMAEQYHLELFDRDHAEALQKNAVLDTLQSILDDDSVTQAQNIIAKLRRNWIVEALTRE